MEHENSQVVEMSSINRDQSQMGLVFTSQIETNDAKAIERILQLLGRYGGHQYRTQQAVSQILNMIHERESFWKGIIEKLLIKNIEESLSLEDSNPLGSQLYDFSNENLSEKQKREIIELQQNLMNRKDNKMLPEDIMQQSQSLNNPKEMGNILIQQKSSNNQSILKQFQQLPIESRPYSKQLFVFPDIPQLQPYDQSGDQGHNNYFKLLSEAIKFEEMENYQKSLKYFRKCLKNQNDNNQIKVSAIGHIGRIYFKRQQFDKAQRIYLQLLEIQKTLFGLKCDKCVKTLMNIGKIHINNGNSQKALIYLKQSIQIEKQIIGQYSDTLVEALATVGEVNLKMQNTRQSIKYYEECLKIKRKKYGNDSVDIISALSNAAIAYGANGNKTKAKEYLQQSLRIQENKTGKGSIQTIPILNTAKLLNNYYMATQRSGQQLVFPQENQSDSLHNLPQTSRQSVQFNKIQSNQRTLFNTNNQANNNSSQKFTKQRGTNLVQVAGKFIQNGQNYLRMKEFQKALEQYSNALQIYQDKLGLQSTEYISTLAKIQQVWEFLEQENDTENEKCYETEIQDQMEQQVLSGKQKQ